MTDAVKIRIEVAFGALFEKTLVDGARLAEAGLPQDVGDPLEGGGQRLEIFRGTNPMERLEAGGGVGKIADEIGRASCRERV